LLAGTQIINLSASSVRACDVYVMGIWQTGLYTEERILGKSGDCWKAVRLRTGVGSIRGLDPTPSRVWSRGGM